MENAIAIAFALLGTFYMFGGYAVMRAIAMDGLIDRAIERINLQDDPLEPVSTERFKQRFLGIMAIVSFAGGAFLFFQSAFSTALFCICLAMQLLHVFVLGPRHFDHDGDSDLEASGRQATMNAMVIYAVVTLCLLYAQLLGSLPSFPTSWSRRETAGLAVTITFAIYAFWMTRLPRSDADIWSSAQTNDQTLQADISDPGRYNKIGGIAELRVQATAHEEGLWARSEATEIWETADLNQIGVSIALESRILKWEEKYDRFCNTEETDALNDEPIWNDAEKQTHFQEAHSIAQLLKDELNSMYPDMVKITWINQDGEILQIPT